MIVFVLSFGTRGYQTEKLIPPYYQLELQGLNNRISNEISDFDHAPYIQGQMERFMAQWGLRGVSIAVVKDEQLVYAQGFGMADDNGTQVQPGHLFRLASVSKLITAVAIMKLVEENKLSLDDCVFGPDGILKNPILDQVRDKKIYRITVRHLLAHSGGWTQRYGDPAFNLLTIAEKLGDMPPASIETLYRYISTRWLSFAPGSQVAYSNIGYMFLGEVISKAAGKPYETYIQDDVLLPCGIMDMHVGNSYQKYRQSNEVQYYEQDGSEMIPEFNGSGMLVAKSNGGNPIEMLGAAGGWISSAAELAKFITLIDGQSAIADILTEKSILEMTDNTYAKGPLGWKTTLSNGNWWRTGSMAGTSAMLKKQPDGITWVFLANSSSWKGSMLPAEIDRLMHKITSLVKEWPERDLFNYYPIHSLPLAYN
ncbi:serine hydrolase domain-containing protein [Gaoshiqia sp. Z1-71]|uniref:serine hydrolase domain-containing protein n=1 Tax=Gaoshiqia hydrogeniformans TaxID=3290090 RepID=UPI003BF87D9D